MNEKSYEQARERVAVPSREEIARGLNKAAAATGNAWQWDRLDPNGADTYRAEADYVLTLLRQAPSAQPWTRELAEKFATVWVGRAPQPWDAFVNEVHRVGLGVFGATAPVASAQGGDLDAPTGCGKAPMQCISCDDFRLAIDEGRAETHRYKTALEQEKQEHASAVEQLESLERDLATERAAHEATLARLKQRSADLEATTVRKATAEQAAGDFQARAEAAEKRAAEREREREREREKACDWNTRFYKEWQRAADAEYERDALQAKLEALRGACAFQGGEVLALDSERTRAREGNPLSAVRLAREERIQSALAQESAKPAEPEPATPDLDLAGRMRVLEELAKNTAIAVIANLHGWHTVEQECGATYERIDMALKALEGGGSNG